MYVRSDAFGALVKSALTPSIKVIIQGNTFSINQDLKRLEFRFEPNTKSWVRFVADNEQAEKLKTTLETTYKEGSVNFSVEFKEFNAKTRYKR